MAVGLGVRTIWILIRAMNYTDQAFRAIQKNISETMKFQQAFRAQAMRMVSAGIMWTFLGTMIVGSLMQIMQASAQGRMELAKFQNQMGMFTRAFSMAVVKAFGPFLRAIGNVLEALSKNEALLMILAYAVTFVIAPLVLLAGVIITVSGVMQLLGTKSIPMLITKIFGLQVSTQSLVLTMAQLAAVTGMAFAIFVLLQERIGTIPAALIALAVAVGILAIKLWLAAGAMSVLTWGLAAIAGGAALAGVLAMMGNIREFQMGTIGAPETMMAVVHKGEVIYNPASGKPTGIDKDFARSPARVTRNDIKIEIGTVHTKADFDDLGYKIKRALKEALDEKS